MSKSESPKKAKHLVERPDLFASQEALEDPNATVADYLTAKLEAGYALILVDQTGRYIFRAV